MTLVCFILTFYSPKRKKLAPDEYEIPKGDIYEVYRDDMIGWTKDIRSMPRDDVSITSDDGLTLRGKYYEYKKGAPIEILFHGYRGNAERDLCGAVHRCYALGRNALIADHRASGESDGHVITFGIKERLDCKRWVEYAVCRFGKDSKIMITGISMGAATVMMALNEPLPENVVLVLSDCGYTSPRDIIRKVLRDIHLPVWLFYPFIKLGARIFGGFDLEEASAEDGVQKSNIPIIFIHGDRDDFVPCDMSRKLYSLCTSEHKKLYTVPGVGHGLAFPADKDGYYKALREFEKECGAFTQ
jgi:fermentation-respiration switch protein FrsA (DUF1100 family)